MRFLAAFLVLGALGVLARTAAADVEDSQVVAVPKLAAGGYITGHAGTIDGANTGGVGATLEVALGHGRSQYFVEGGLGVAGVGTGTEDDAWGKLVRGAAGARWIARSFELDRRAALELTLEGFGGARRYAWDNGGTLVRPELGLGWGWQVRRYRRPHVSIRFSMRVYFAPGNHAATTVARCTACDPSADAPLSNSGFMVSIGALR